MLSDDSGWTRLAVRPHPDDADQRNVVLVWEGVEFVSLSAPNDEAISGHRLWRAGLNDVLWLGLVEDSELIASLRKQNSVHPHHESRRCDFPRPLHRTTQGARRRGRSTLLGGPSAGRKHIGVRSCGDCTLIGARIAACPCGYAGRSESRSRATASE